MNRIAHTFARLRAAGRGALMPYLMTGFPHRESLVDLVPALEAAGADMFEIGVPFSDPIADGVTIQHAAERALYNGTTLAFCIESVARVRERGVVAPLLLMGYYNPLLRYGLARACADIAAAGGDGLIVPDVPPEEITELHQAARAHHLDVILFVAPTTPDERIATITRYASGFLYCVSLTGVTGARQSLSHGLAPFLARVRRHTNLPLVVGFGISTAEHVATVHTMADGAIVGSALIKTIEQAPDDHYVAQAVAYVQHLCTHTTP